MNKLLSSIIIIVFVITSHVSFAQHTVSDLAGRWESTDGTIGNVEFMDGSKVVVAINGMQIPAASYSVDFSRSPIWFDVFVATNKTVKGILEFMDDDTIKWQVFVNGDRNYDFMDAAGSPILILKRKK